MDKAKSIKTPVNASVKLTQADEESEEVEKALYQSAVGSLLYLSTHTRPDIAFAVSNVPKFCSTQHRSAVKRIFRYIKGTADYGLLYDGDGSQECVGYLDADWARDVRLCIPNWKHHNWLEKPETNCSCSVNSRGRVYGTRSCCSGS